MSDGKQEQVLTELASFYMSNSSFDFTPPSSPVKVTPPTSDSEQEPAPKQEVKRNVYMNSSQVSSRRKPGKPGHHHRRGGGTSRASSSTPLQPVNEEGGSSSKGRSSGRRGASSRRGHVASSSSNGGGGGGDAPRRTPPSRTRSSEGLETSGHQRTAPQRTLSGDVLGASSHNRSVTSSGDDAVEPVKSSRGGSALDKLKAKRAASSNGRRPPGRSRSSEDLPIAQSSHRAKSSGRRRGVPRPSRTSAPATDDGRPEQEHKTDKGGSGNRGGGGGSALDKLKRRATSIDKGDKPSRSSNRGSGSRSPTKYSSRRGGHSPEKHLRSPGSSRQRSLENSPKKVSPKSPRNVVPKSPKRTNRRARSQSKWSSIKQRAASRSTSADRLPLEEGEGGRGRNPSGPATLGSNLARVAEGSRPADRGLTRRNSDTSLSVLKKAAEEEEAAAAAAEEEEVPQSTQEETSHLEEKKKSKSSIFKNLLRKGKGKRKEESGHQDADDAENDDGVAREDGKKKSMFKKLLTKSSHSKTVDPGSNKAPVSESSLDDTNKSSEFESTSFRTDDRTDTHISPKEGIKKKSTISQKLPSKPNSGRGNFDPESVKKPVSETSLGETNKSSEFDSTSEDRTETITSPKGIIKKKSSVLQKLLSKSKGGSKKVDPESSKTHVGEPSLDDTNKSSEFESTSFRTEDRTEAITSPKGSAKKKSSVLQKLLSKSKGGTKKVDPESSKRPVSEPSLDDTNKSSGVDSTSFRADDRTETMMSPKEGGKRNSFVSQKLPSKPNSGSKKNDPGGKKPASETSPGERNKSSEFDSTSFRAEDRTETTDSPREGIKKRSSVLQKLLSKSKGSSSKKIDPESTQSRDSTTENPSMVEDDEGSMGSLSELNVETQGIEPAKTEASKDSNNKKSSVFQKLMSKPKNVTPSPNKSSKTKDDVEPKSSEKKSSKWGGIKSGMGFTSKLMKLGKEKKAKEEPSDQHEEKDVKADETESETPMEYGMMMSIASFSEDALAGLEEFKRQDSTDEGGGEEGTVKDEESVDATANPSQRSLKSSSRSMRSADEESSTREEETTPVVSALLRENDKENDVPDAFAVLSAESPAPAPDRRGLMMKGLAAPSIRFDYDTKAEDSLPRSQPGIIEEDEEEEESDDETDEPSTPVHAVLEDDEEEEEEDMPQETSADAEASEHSGSHLCEGSFSEASPGYDQDSFLSPMKFMQLKIGEKNVPADDLSIAIHALTSNSPDVAGEPKPKVKKMNAKGIDFQSLSHYGGGKTTSQQKETLADVQRSKASDPATASLSYKKRMKQELEASTARIKAARAGVRMLQEEIQKQRRKYGEVERRRQLCAKDMERQRIFLKR